MLCPVFQTILLNHTIVTATCEWEEFVSKNCPWKGWEKKLPEQTWYNCTFYLSEEQMKHPKQALNPTNEKKLSGDLKIFRAFHWVHKKKHPQGCVQEVPCLFLLLPKACPGTWKYSCARLSQGSLFHLTQTGIWDWVSIWLKGYLAENKKERAAHTQRQVLASVRERRDEQSGLL